MRARLIIAILSVPLLLTGLILALDLPRKFAFSGPEWGYTLFSLGADIALVYLIIDFLLLHEERQRWKAVEGKAIELIQSRLYGVFFLVFNLLVPPIRMSFSKEEKMSRMRELVADPIKLRNAMRPPSVDLSSYFQRMARGVGDLQHRYSSRLDPRLISILIDVENSLESISSFLEVAKMTPPIVSDIKEDTWLPFLDLITAETSNKTSFIRSYTLDYGAARYALQSLAEKAKVEKRINNSVDRAKYSSHYSILSVSDVYESRFFPQTPQKALDSGILAPQSVQNFVPAPDCGGLAGLAFTPPAT